MTEVETQSSVSHGSSLPPDFVPSKDQMNYPYEPQSAFQYRSFEQDPRQNSPNLSHRTAAQNVRTDMAGQAHRSTSFPSIEVPTPNPCQQVSAKVAENSIGQRQHSYVPAIESPTGGSPKFDPEHYANDDVDSLAVRHWTNNQEKVIKGPYDYIASEPGKEFRTQIIHALNEWLQVPEERLAVIIEVVRMLHTSSLLIDDIQDNSQLRRGKPVAHNIFGVAQTINAGNYVYFLALKELQKLESPNAAMDIYVEEVLALHRGQGMDLYWRDTLTCPEEADYLVMAANKTGGLFRLAIRLMMSESPTDIDCIPLANLSGLLFQIADDYKNLANLDYTVMKGLCEDLTEGKFSFPIIHSIRSDTENKELLNILSQKPTEDEIKKHAVRYIEGTGSLEYSRRVVQILSKRAQTVTDEIDAGRGRSGAMHKVLAKFAAI